ncbi:MAG: iron-sulfur cluster biosynthesis family protein [Bacillota bacterium]
MNFIVTESAKEALHKVDNNHMIQLSFELGDCDIVNNIYEMKVIPRRDAYIFEKIEDTGALKFLIAQNFEDLYSEEVVIDFSGQHFIFRNKNQIFNNKVKLTY